MASTLTANGLQIDRYPTIIEQLISRQQEIISPDIVAADDEFLGQMNKILAERESNILSLIEATSGVSDIDSAEGIFLDNLGKLLKISRRQPLATQGYIDFKGTPATTIPSGTIIEQRLTKDRYVLTSTVNIDNAVSVANEILVSTVAAGTYTITLNGSTFSYSAGGGVTLPDILSNFVIGFTGNTYVVVTQNASATGLNFVSTNPSVPYSVTVTSNLLVNTTTSRGYASATVIGPLSAAVGTMTKLITPVLGLDSVNNTVALTAGRNLEEDEDYRLRMKVESSSQGLATAEAVKAYLEDVTNITLARVYSNNTMSVDGDGRPAKSVECIVVGGTNTDVAKAVHYAVAAGIETYGNTGPIAFNDADGTPIEVKFSRPTAKNFAIKVEYTLYPEETFPVGGATTIRLAVLEYVNSLGIGIDLIPKRIYKPVYDAVKGISEVTVTAQAITNPGDTPGGSWLDTRISVTAAQYAQTAVGDITVTQV